MPNSAIDPYGIWSQVKKGEIKGFGLKSKVSQFFQDNGIDADVEATLDIWEGKEEALMKRMQAHMSDDDSQGELVHGILTNGDILWLEAAFKNYTEESKLEYLTKSEFFEVVAKLSPVPPSDKDLEAAFVIADADNSGGIDQEEFIALFAKVSLGPGNTHIRPCACARSTLHVHVNTHAHT